MLNFFFETFRLGVRNLRLHKLRTLLTALGIIFGVTAVIIMVAIGEGNKQAALEQLRQLGARNILVRSEKPPESSDAGAKQQRVLDYGIKRLDLERLRTLPGVVTFVPMKDTEQKVIHKDVRATANPIGTTPEAFNVINLRLARGRFWNGVDYERSQPVCVIGALVAQTLFPYEDPIGTKIQIGSGDTSVIVCTVVGVLEPTGLRGEGAAMINRNLDQDVYFPLSLAHAAFGDTIIRRPSGGFIERKKVEISEIWLQVARIEDVERTAGMVDNLMSINHTGKPDYQVKAPIQILRSAEKVQQQFNYIMVGIASFALVVGGIGIMNIMLANVTERTKEIGIRRALGAKQRHITLQFLIETTVISLTGGLIGIAAGCGFATLLPPLVKWATDAVFPTQITTWSVVGSFVISGMIGIGFGLYPAIMAAKMNPIDALRHE